MTLGIKIGLPLLLAHQSFAVKLSIEIP